MRGGGGGMAKYTLYNNTHAASKQCAVLSSSQIAWPHQIIPQVRAEANAREKKKEREAYKSNSKKTFNDDNSIQLHYINRELA